MDMPKLSFLLLILLVSNLFGQGVWEPASDYDVERNPTSIHFIDPYEGWVSLPYEGLVNTQDEGQSWNRSGPDLVVTPQIEFFDLDTGWVAESSSLYYTVDGGVNWEEGDYVGRYIMDLCFINGQTGWACGVTMLFGNGEIELPTPGSISVTHDGGRTWEIQLLEQDAPGMGKICFADEDHGIASYVGNSLLITENGGEDWEVVEDLPFSFYTLEHIRDGIFIGTGQVMVDGNWIRIIGRTTDFGIEWDTVWNSEDMGEGARVSKISFVNDDVGFVSGTFEENPFMLRTEDGGLNWEDFPIPGVLEEGGGEIRCISFPTPWRGYAGVTQGRNFRRVFVWTDTEQIVRLNMDEGWNMVSINVDPGERAIDEVVQSLVRSEALTLMKDHNGNFYSPAREFNNIPTPWAASQGYMVRVDREVHLTVAGNRIELDTPIELNEGWQMVAYYPREGLEVPEALESIQDDIITAKDDNGRFYLPEFNFNNMPAMVEGRGYLLKMENEAELVYPWGE